MNILKQAENGIPVAQLCPEHGMSSAAFYKWRSKWRYGRFAKKENRILKRMYAKEKMKAEVIAEILAKN